MNNITPKLLNIVMTVIFLFFTLNVIAEDRFKQCIDAIEQGNLSVAISCLRDAVRKEKKNSEGYIWLGTALLKADSAEGAVAALVQARELDASNPQIYMLLGDAYMKQNIYGAAVQQYQQAIQLDSSKAECYVKLADAYKKNRQYNEAARAYTRAIVLDTTNIEVIRELGTIYFRANQYANAVPLLERVARYQPDSLNVQIQFAKALHYIKAHERFIPVAERILQKDSSQTEIFNMLGESYFETKDCENANKILSRIRSDSLNAKDLIKIGKVKKCIEMYDDAIAIYEEAYRKDSTLSEIYYDLGTMYMKKKNWKNAVPMFEKKMATDTTSGFQWASSYNAALCLMQLKDFARAKVFILKSLEIKPEYIQGWSALASCYAQMDSGAAQVEAYKKVVELIIANSNGNGEKYKDQLEEAYRMIGFQILTEGLDAIKKEKSGGKEKFASALEYFKKALKINPKDCELLYYAGVAAQNSNNKEDAKRFYCKVIEVCPKSKRVEESKKFLDLLGLTCGE